MEADQGPHRQLEGTLEQRQQQATRRAPIPGTNLGRECGLGGKYYETYRFKTISREHRSMQSPEVDGSTIKNEVTFTEPNALRSSELHKVTIESIL